MENAFSLIFAFLVEAIILLQYASRLFSPKRPLSGRLVVLSLLYTCLCAAAFFNIKWLNMLWYLFANFLFLVTQYDVKWRAAAFHSALLATVMGMCELIVYSIIARTAPHFYMQMGSFHNTLLFILCSKISFFAVIYLITHLFKSRQKTTDPYDSSVVLLMIIPVTSIFIMLTFVGMGDQYTLTPGTNRMISLSAFFLLLMNLLVFGINQYNREKNRKYTEVQLLLQKETDFTEYYKMLLSQSENQAILIHDIKKHLQSIASLNEQNAPEKYSNCGQLFRLPDGLPIAPEQLTKWYRLWRAQHPQFEQIVFHGLRHSSATYQLLQSDGDFKSVQGNTGHATATVLMDTYAHTQDKPRLELTEKIEADFYTQDVAGAKPQEPPENKTPVATKITGKMILEAIRQMDAEERRELTRVLFA